MTANSPDARVSGSSSCLAQEATQRRPAGLLWLCELGSELGAPLFEQIVEGLLRAARRRRGRGRRAGCRRAGLALDGGAGREQRAAVALVFRRHARRDAVVERTFPADAGVERHALDAGMHVDAAAGTAIEQADRERQQVPAARASKHFARRHEVGCFRPALVLQLTSGRTLLGRPRRLGRLWSAFAGVVLLVPALPVFPVAHFRPVL